VWAVARMFIVQFCCNRCILVRDPGGFGKVSAVGHATCTGTTQCKLQNPTDKRHAVLADAVQGWGE
jgi:hypothetical protein